MKNKKGFTLIELLAVIVILAVIMVVAVPKILTVIESSKTRAFENSKKLITKTIKTQLASSNIIGGNSFTKDDNNCYVFDFDNKNSNYQNLNVKNKENFSGSISYCEKQITYNDFSDGKNIVNGEDKVETPTTPSEPVVNRIDLKSKILDGGATLTGVTATASGDNVLLSSPYGSNGYVYFNEDYSNYNITKMYVKGHRNTGDSTYYHFNLVAINKDTSEGIRGLWYPVVGEDFEYILNISENTNIINPYIEYCVGDIVIEELYLEYTSKEELEEDVVEPVVTRVDLKSKILSENAKLTNMSATADGDNIILTSPYGNDGIINFTEDFSEYSFTKMYVKGHRNTGDSTYNHLFLYYFDLSDVQNRATWYPKPGEDFEYTIEIPEGTKIKKPSFSFCVGEIIIEELYLE